MNPQGKDIIADTNKMQITTMHQTSCINKNTSNFILYMCYLMIKYFV